MSKQNQNKENFSFQLGKLKLDANQPGKETRKTLALAGLIIILLLIVVGLIFYFLKINLAAAGLLTGGAAVASNWLGKGGRGP